VAGCEATGETASITVADTDGTQEAFTDDEDTVFEFGQQGISCESSGGQRSDENNENDAKNAEGPEDLGCEKLLVLFRGESGSEAQYAEAAVFADSEMRAEVEVCLEREIVKGTAADEGLPDTGGPSLLALAVLGLVSAAAGLSVIRGGRR
jgi:hypothetical protein